MKTVTYVCPKSKENVTLTSEFFAIGVDGERLYHTFQNTIKCPHIYKDAKCDLYSYPFSCSFIGLHTLDE